MNLTETQINAADGTLLMVRHAIPQNFKRLAILVHGLGEHSARYAEMAGFFNSKGFAVFTLDHRGHGLSGGRRAHVDTFSDYISDLLIVTKKASAMTGKKRFFMLGHSMGGLIATLFAGSKPELLDGLVLSSPFFGFAEKVPIYKAIPGKILSGLMPTLSMATGLDPNVISHDKNVVNAYASDPLTLKTVTTRWFTEAKKAQEEAKNAVQKYKGPLLVMQAGDDKLVSPSTTQEVFELSQSNPKEFHMLEGFYHEIFNEVERAKPYGLLDKWLNSVIGV